jgi:hypothetical protein
LPGCTRTHHKPTRTHQNPPKDSTARTQPT